MGESEQKQLGSSCLQEENCSFHKSWMYMHFSRAIARAGAFEQHHTDAKCWASPQDVQMQQPKVAEELKEEQELRDLNPEARNRSQTGWDSLEVSSWLFPASLCRLFTANIRRDGKKRMGIAEPGARKRTTLSCQKAAFTLLFQVSKAQSGEIATTWVKDGYTASLYFKRSMQPLYNF